MTSKVLSGLADGSIRLYGGKETYYEFAQMNKKHKDIARLVTSIASAVIITILAVFTFTASLSGTMITVLATGIVVATVALIASLVAWAILNKKRHAMDEILLNSVAPVSGEDVAKLRPLIKHLNFLKNKKTPTDKVDDFAEALQGHRLVEMQIRLAHLVSVRHINIYKKENGHPLIFDLFNTEVFKHWKDLTREKTDIVKVMLKELLAAGVNPMHASTQGETFFQFHMTRFEIIYLEAEKVSIDVEKFVNVKKEIFEFLLEKGFRDPEAGRLAQKMVIEKEQARLGFTSKHVVRAQELHTLFRRYGVQSTSS